jgi:hypothetical protein
MEGDKLPGITSYEVVGTSIKHTYIIYRSQ